VANCSLVIKQSLFIFLGCFLLEQKMAVRTAVAEKFWVRVAILLVPIIAAMAAYGIYTTTTRGAWLNELFFYAIFGALPAVMLGAVYGFLKYSRQSWWLSTLWILFFTTLIYFVYVRKMISL
jgi:hypothetical protein